METRTEAKVEARKTGWMITAVALIVFSVCLCAAMAFTLMHNNKSKMAVERTYERNLYELGDNLNNIEINLSKLMMSPDGAFATMLLTDVHSEALAAGQALASLPIDTRDTEEAAGFLNQVADFAVSYQRTLVAGNSGRAFADNVENMYIAARQLNAEVSDSVSLVAQNKMDIRKLTIAKPFALRTDDKMQHTAIEYPELIYDGPFSDGRAKDTYHYFCDEQKITIKEAKEIALAALPDLKAKTVTSAGKSQEEPMFELTVSGDRGNAYFTISESGGKIVNMTLSRPLGAVMLGETSAKACAVEFAKRMGYDVQPVWYLSSGGVAYVNLAPVENDVVLYTDLVKVKIALDNGEAMGLEAGNYCRNHTCRDTKLTMNRAAVPTLIDSRLQLKSVRGALIPLENNVQRLCYEAACEYKGLDYFVYLDAATGETVKIMRTVDSEQGSLVM